MDRELVTRARDGDRAAFASIVTGSIDGDPLYVAAVVGGTPWLVATRRAWRWE